MLDEYYRAFSEPSSEHIWIYVRVFCFLGGIGYAIWYLFIGSQRKEETYSVNMSDIGGKFVDSDSDGNKRKAGASSSTVKTGETQASTANQKEEEVTEYRSMSLKKEFNKRGPYPLTEDGKMLTKEAYAKVYAIMNKHVWIKFHITKKSLVENRYGLYQDR